MTGRARRDATRDPGRRCRSPRPYFTAQYSYWATADDGDASDSESPNGNAEFFCIMAAGALLSLLEYGVGDSSLEPRPGHTATAQRALNRKQNELRSRPTRIVPARPVHAPPCCCWSWLVPPTFRDARSWTPGTWDGTRRIAVGDGGNGARHDVLSGMHGGMFHRIACRVG